MGLLLSCLPPRAHHADRRPYCQSVQHLLTHGCVKPTCESGHQRCKGLMPLFGQLLWLVTMLACERPQPLLDLLPSPCRNLAFSELRCNPRCPELRRFELCESRGAPTTLRVGCDDRTGQQNHPGLFSKKLSFWLALLPLPHHVDCGS
jgi:hypothetical protein